MNSDIERQIAEEAAASEANPDAPIPAGAAVSRPNRARSTVYSVRLDPDEVAAVQALADAAGLPASTLVRSWIVERVRSRGRATRCPASPGPPPTPPHPARIVNRCRGACRHPVGPNRQHRRPIGLREAAGQPRSRKSDYGPLVSN
jgi:hypothetical protein